MISQGLSLRGAELLSAWEQGSSGSPLARMTREPRAARARNDRRFALPRSPQMLAQESDRARPGKGGARLVVALPLVAVEAVVGGIDVDFDLRVGGGDLFHPCDRDMLVLLAEMQHRRDLRLQVLEPDDPAAVVADCGAQAVKAPRRHPGESAAHAEADDGDLASLLGDRDRGGDVAQRLLTVNFAGDRHAARSRGRVVAGLEPGLDMLENRRRYGQIALGRKPVRDIADMRIDAEDLLDDDDRAARSARGIGAPGSNRARAFRLQFNPGAHVDLLQVQAAPDLLCAMAMPPTTNNSART